MEFYIPIIGLGVAVFTLVFLVLRTRIHVLLAMLFAAVIAGVSGGLTMSHVVEVIATGFGTTLGNIGLVIGLGSMMGRILEVSGATERIAYSLIKWLGKRREEWALAITGYIVSIPIFVNSAFIVLYPLVKALAKKGKRNILTLGVSLAGGLVVTHHIVPPTPGPLSVAGIFGVNIGSMMIAGMILAVPCVIGITVYAKWLEKKYPEYQLIEESGNLQQIHQGYMEEKENKPLPSLFLSLLPIVVPISLIFINVINGILLEDGDFSGMKNNFYFQAFNFLGSPIIALAISVLLSVYTLMPKVSKQEVIEHLENGLKTVGVILLVSGAGGALGAVLKESSTGMIVAKYIATLPITPVLIPFIIATLIRIIQGSGTVAMITAASISAPVIKQMPDINMLVAAQAAVMGTLFFSYFNDCFFWVVNRMMGIKNTRQQIIVWSIPTTIAWGIGLCGVLILNLVL
ncbi:gluconate:H+ symporter [Xenorhabdus szentirmaii]|uniref:GntP family permease n=1 Tax=Xenorhabdus szentirmaii TaxID=290112 RepID=A0AAW3YR87_9GAMM|nr:MULTISPECIES: gluconate:H+ symporter [unclassified Xenorhabdus]MBD2799599.1 GntP family permease [Xenorhabdus sp. M]MBD2805633.1 GntP family permease [Xenorhabdus sp. ZM]